MAYVDVVMVDQLSPLFSLLRMDVPETTMEFPTLNVRTDFVRFHLGQTGQVLCTLRSGIRHIGNQMHHRRLCHEGLSELLDLVDQVYRSPPGDRFGPLGG